MSGFTIAESDETVRADNQRELPPPSIGRFVVIRELGSGGSGSVYLAHDPVLDRLVALKVVRPGQRMTADLAERFRREARSAAQLRHPGIVAIHAVEQEGDVPFIVCEYVDGMTLSRFSAKCQPSFRNIAEIIRDVARALQFAHSRGIVHRDVKPENILIDKTGAPRLADFGLAKRTDDIKMTAEGQILGTPAYMSPEQAGSQGKPIGPLTDVYSLGVVLYVLLTGELPFRGKLPMVIRQVVKDLPRSPCSLNDAAPLDLETICQKAMEKEPHRRYPTAGEMADDLDRWLTNRPIRARHIGPVGKLRRWARRNPEISLLVTAVTLLLISIAGISLWMLRQQTLAVREQQQLLNRLYVGRGTSHFDPEFPWGCPNPLAALPWLVSGLEADAEAPEREHIDRMRLGVLLRSSPRIVQFIAEEEPITFATFSPDTSTILTCGSGSYARLWSSATGEPTGVKLSHQDRVIRGVFSPDGRLVATCALDGTARIWESKSGHPVTDFLRHNPTTPDHNFGIVITKAAFNPDGSRLVTTGVDHTARIWDSRTGKLVISPLQLGAAVMSAEFDVTGDLLLTTSTEESAHVWDAANGRLIAEFTEHGKIGGRVLVARFSPDGRTVASGDNRGNVFVWDARTCRVLGTTVKHEQPISAITFSPDGKLLGTSSRDGTARLWTVPGLKPHGRTISHAQSIGGINFSKTGTLLATRSDDGAVVVRNVETGAAAFAPLYHGRPAGCCEFSADARLLLTASLDGGVRLWELSDRSVKTTPISASSHAELASFSPDARSFATSGRHTVTLGGLESGAPSLELHEHKASVTALAFTERSELLASGSIDGTIAVWDVPSGKLACPLLRQGGSVTSLAFSGSEPRVLLATDPTAIHAWDPKTGQHLAGPIQHSEAIGRPDITRDGRYIAVTRDRTVGLYDTRHSTLLEPSLTHSATVQGVRFSHDGSRLLTLAGFALYEWSVPAGMPEPTPLAHSVSVTDFEIDPTEHLAATIGSDRTVRVWNIGENRQILSLVHPDPVRSVAFSARGDLLATLTSTKTIQVWDLRTGLRLTPPLVQAFDVRAICFEGEGDSVACLTSGNTLAHISLRPSMVPSDALRLLAAIYSTAGLDISPLQSPRINERLATSWKTLKSQIAQ